MPQYPPSPGSFYWQVNLAITTPVGLVAGSIALQSLPDGTGTALLSSRLFNSNPLIGVWNGGKILRGNAYYDQTENNTARYGPGWLSGGYQNVGSGADEEHFGSLPRYVGPDYLIGINVGVRRGGRLGCNISIGLLPASGQKITEFWQQDVSYFRFWDLPRPIPPVVVTNDPLSVKDPAGWHYMKVASNIGALISGLTTLAPFPTRYDPQPPIRYGGGSPVWASAGSDGLGQLYQFVYPTSIMSASVPDPMATVWQTSVDAYLAEAANPSNANQFAFVGDVFLAPPFNYISAYNPGGTAWFEQPVGDSYYGACAAQRAIFGNSDAVYGGAGVLSPLGPPIYVPSFVAPVGWSLLPGFNGGPLDPAFDTSDTGLAPIFRANPGGPIAIGAPATMPAMLPQLGVSLGLGCTVYYLNVLKIPVTPAPPPPPPPRPCNIRIVQTATTTSRGNVTQLSSAFNNNVMAGNTLLVVVRGENNQPITLSDSQGNSYVADVQQDNQSDYILSAWRTTAGASGPLTVTVTTPPTFPAGGPIGMTLDLMEVAGLAPAGLVLTGYRTGLSGEVWIVGDGAVGDNCDLLIASYVAETNTQTYPDPPWTTLEPDRQDPTGDTVWQETHGLVIGPSAYWTLQEAIPWTALMVAYKTA